MERANPSLRQAARNAAQRLGLRAFWQWWMGQLAPLVPAAPRNAMRRRRLRPLLALQTDTAVVWTPTVKDGKLGFAETARIPLSGDPATVAREGRAVIESLPRIAYGGAVAEAKVVVALAPGHVLRKTFTLPAAVEESLQQTLAYDLDRHTPFKADEVYFDAVVTGRDPQKKEIRVDFAAALKTVVDQACQRAESWGAAVVGVTPDAPAGPAMRPGTTLNLLPAAQRPETAAWRRPEIWMPLLLIVAIAVVAAALPIWQKRGYAIAMMQLAEQARVQADASNALRQQLEQLTADYNFPLQRKYSFPAAVQVVEDVTKLLPDDTWLTQFEVKTKAQGKEARRELLLRGESGNAGRLISLLEESKLFEQAAPRSPTTKIQPGPGEIFDLTAQLKPLPPPQPVQLASAPAAEGASPGGVEAGPPPALPGAAPDAQPPAKSAEKEASARAPAGAAPAKTGEAPVPANGPPGKPSAAVPSPGAMPPPRPGGTPPTPPPVPAGTPRPPVNPGVVVPATPSMQDEEVLKRFPDDPRFARSGPAGAAAKGRS